MNFIQFRKLFETVEEGGYYSFAIISYMKSPVMFKVTEPDVHNMVHSYVSQYRKYLQIDLWIFILKFKWLTKEK